MSLQETVKITTEIIVSSNDGELPTDHKLANLLRTLLIEYNMSDDTDVTFISVQVTGRTGELD